MIDLTLNVKGMACKHCEDRVVTALKAHKGIKKPSADAKSGIVTLKYDEDKISTENIKEIIEETGFEVL